MRDECNRTRLIAELSSLLRECDELPAEARSAGLTLIGYLARRMPGEGPSTVGVVEVTAQAAAVTVRGAEITVETVDLCASVKNPFAA